MSPERGHPGRFKLNATAPLSIHLTTSSTTPPTPTPTPTRRFAGVPACHAESSLFGPSPTKCAVGPGYRSTLDRGGLSPTTPSLLSVITLRQPMIVKFRKRIGPPTHPRTSLQSSWSAGPLGGTLASAHRRTPEHSLWGARRQLFFILYFFYLFLC